MINKYGVDTNYFKKELELLSNSLDNRTPDELRNYLINLSDTAKQSESYQIDKNIPIPEMEYRFTNRSKMKILYDNLINKMQPTDSIEFSSNTDATNFYTAIKNRNHKALIRHVSLDKHRVWML